MVAAGGAVGAVLRYFVGLQASQRFGQRFPIGTLSINLSACFLIGCTLEYLNQHNTANPIVRYAFAIGFIGAYSTFSTFEWEIWSDITHGSFWIGMLYLTVSLVGGLIAVALGAASARAIP